MTVHVVTTASNLATVNSSMASGDFMQFTAGTYSISSVLNLVNGCSYIGNPGAILSTTAAVDIFDIVTGTNNNIYISGLTFDETNHLSPNAAIFISGNNGAVGSGVNNITISNCTFQNIGGTTNSILGYQMDYCRIDNNLFSNCYQGVSLINNDASNTHGYISVSGNTFRAMARMGIETQGNSGTAIFHLHVNNNTFYDIQNEESISMVEGFNTGVDIQCCNNAFWSCASAIEMSNANATMAGNIFTNCNNCFLLADNPSSMVYGNIMRGCNNSNIFGQDGGGWAGSQYIGYNMINGAVVFGNSSGTYGTAAPATTGFSGTAFTIPDYVPQTLAQLDALFANNQPQGTITPQYVRNLFAALANPAYLNSSTYP